MRKELKKRVEETYRELASSGQLPEGQIPQGHLISIPKQEEHGDFASNFALMMASVLKMPPRKIAEALGAVLEKDAIFSKVEVAGPGFLNFFISDSFWQNNLKTILEAGSSYGQSAEGMGRKVLVEFVSANPTGPLHVGHGRGAAVGDSLARVLKAAGYDVTTEYYINDAGNQMQTLGRSVYLRYLEHFGHQVEFPKECYQGDYIKRIAQEIAEKEGERFLKTPFEECADFFIEWAVRDISRGIRKDLDDFNVHFDNWYSEKTLHDSSAIEKTIAELMERNVIYEKDGALWFRTTDFGDEKDRVVKRSDGRLTYFAADIAYHRDKYERGFELLVDIWGADHHGYVPRVKAAVEALGHDPGTLKVLLVQLVNLIEGGQLKAMSTRAGEFVTLREVLDDVGTDAARFIFLTRRCDSHLDFDIDLAKSQSQENPVYYVQYAHARLCSVFEKARSAGIELEKPEAGPKEPDLSLLDTPEELRIMKMLASFPELVAGSAKALEPHRISYYLQELAGLLHKFYAKHRFVGEDKALSSARLFMARAVQVVLANGLALLGVSAPEKM